MFEWKMEDMKLYNESKEKGGTEFCQEIIYECENKVSRKDKIAFVDKMQDGKLSYLLELTSKFINNKEDLTKDKYGKIRTVSLKAWIKKSDIRNVLDNKFNYGGYYLLGTSRNITSKFKGRYDTYDDLVDEMFHRQLQQCELDEKKYFLQNDRYSVLKNKLDYKIDRYHTTLGVNIIPGNNGEIYIYGEDKKREITIEEIQILLDKYDRLEKFIKVLKSEVDIKY